MRTLLFVAVLFAATVVHADRRHYTRKQPPAIPVELSQRVKPVRKPAAPPPSRPTVTATDLIEIEGRQQPVRRDQERILEKLIADTPDTDPEKPDYMFRLAEQYAKQLRFYRMKAIAPKMPARAR